MNAIENNVNTINTVDWKKIDTWKLDQYSSDEKSELIDNFSKLPENMDNQNFIDRYKREQYISWLVKTSSFYDEWDTIFTARSFDSKILKINWDDIREIWEQYYDIKKMWNLYVWIKVDIDHNWWKKDWTEKYSLLAKDWNKIRDMKWDVYFREDDNIIIESYLNDKKEKKANIYDADFNIIKKEITKDDVRDYINDLNKDRNLKLAEDGKKNQERLNNMKLKFNINFQWETHFLKTITNINWDIIFDSKWWKYNIVLPNWLYSSTINDNRNKEAINKWIFIITWADNYGEQEELFINTNTDKILKFKDYIWHTTFLKWNVMKHFINSNDSELYNAKTWEKLWKSTTELANEHNFQFISLDDWKYQLVENKTWTVKQQKFDNYIKRYDEWDRKIVIVENNWEIETIEIQK